MSSIIICNAEPADIAKVVDIHSVCFKDSFSTSLGRNILFKYYKSYLKYNPNLFLIAKYDGKIIGFVVGYCCEDNQALVEFKKRNRFKIIFRVLSRMVLFDKRVYRKIFKKNGDEKIIFPNFDSILKEVKCDLLSICVLPEFRKNKIATKLESEFSNVLLFLKRKYCILSCQINNSVANHFYIRQGYIMYKNNNKSNYYIKEISR